MAQALLMEVVLYVLQFEKSFTIYYIKCVRLRIWVMFKNLYEN
jgi:hypothetical protein